VQAIFALYGLLVEVRRIRLLLDDDIWASKEGRDACEAHVDETLRRLRALLDEAQAELDAKSGSA
jgi:hypothetical protein